MIYTFTMLAEILYWTWDIIASFFVSLLPVRWQQRVDYATFIFVAVFLVVIFALIIFVQFI